MLIFCLSFVFCFFCCYRMVFFFFFFSSRRRHTRSDRDWSSDVCSSDLPVGADRRRVACVSYAVQIAGALVLIAAGGTSVPLLLGGVLMFGVGIGNARSEERRVGEEGRSRWAPYH